VFAVDGVNVESDIQSDIFEAQAENVVAYIEGSDPVLKDEIVVISSHYDHIGLTTSGEDRVNNGADDDGSGSVALLEIAEAFMKAREDGYGPRRSILFLHVSGEEKGLLGSAYFADAEPLVPLDDVVTDLNIDMIGRYDPTHPTGSENYVYIIGSNLISQELHDLNARANEETGINIELDERFNSKDDPNRFYARSDHWNFGKHGIPFIFYFTGTHDDYHQPGDEPDKIEYDRMARIAQLIFATAWQVANQDERPAVSGSGFN
jgi:Zn-dependent M28 family amino/carboxypeptidase